MLHENLIEATGESSGIRLVKNHSMVDGNKS